MIGVSGALLFFIIGLIMYGTIEDSKAQAIGLHMLWVGLLVFLLDLSRVIH